MHRNTETSLKSHCFPEGGSVLLDGFWSRSSSISLRRMRGSMFDLGLLILFPDFLAGLCDSRIPCAGRVSRFCSQERLREGEVFPHCERKYYESPQSVSLDLSPLETQHRSQRRRRRQEISKELRELQNVCLSLRHDSRAHGETAVTVTVGDRPHVRPRSKIDQTRGVGTVIILARLISPAGYQFMARMHAR